MKEIEDISVTDNIGQYDHVEKPLVSVIVPGYNEAPILEKNLDRLCRYMDSLERDYRWELIFVNDGSIDDTREIVEAFAKTRDNVFVLHHFTNFRLGQALRYAFNNCRGDYVVTIDVDLSYAPEHIEKLLSKIRETRAKIVIASPYMRSGKVSNVPWLRRILSVWANKYLSFTAPGNLSTLTGMVRAYDAKFLKSLNLKSMDTEINEEIIFKAQLLGARIVEIPAHLDWSFQKAQGNKRRSSLKIVKKMISCLFSGFIFRPFMFFILPGLALMLLSLYPITWALIHTFGQYQKLTSSTTRIDYLFSEAVAAAFIESPHSFLVGGFTLMLAFQLISLGILALQSKRYFEELFHLGSSIYRYSRENSK
ncbi:MAG: glycosyltransferase family 2 protein [Nitrospirota bacterium]